MLNKEMLQAMWKRIKKAKRMRRIRKQKCMKKEIRENSIPVKLT